MKRFSWIAVLTVGFLAFGVGAASAVPAIDGTIGVGEWSAALFNGTDPNEGTITDSWDMSRVRVIQENTGGLNDGLYFLMETYDTPAFTGAPGAGSNEAFFTFTIDFNGNGILTDAVDRRVDFNDTFGAQEVTVRDGTGTILNVGTAGSLGSVIEFFVPESFFPTTSMSGTQLFAQLDNGGSDPDDRLPGSGFLTPVPEPTSSLLFGLGLIGAASFRRFRRFARS